jgi:ribosomal subunit interface protein
MLNINYKYNDLEEAKILAPVMDAKLQVLQKFIDEGTSVFCEVEFEKVSGQHSGRIFRVEVNATVGGKLYRADATEESFEKAIDEVRNEIDKELRRAKGKESSILKRAGRKLKETLLRG